MNSKIVKNNINNNHSAQPSDWRGNVLVIALITLFFILGCNNSETDLDKFFMQVDNVLTNEEKANLGKGENIDRVMNFVLSNSNNDFKLLFDTLPPNIINLLDSSGVEEYSKLSLFVAYVKNKNGKEFSFKEIEKEIEIYFNNRKIDSEQFMRENINRLIKIAESNYERINIGDTICLEFPMRNDNGNYEALYRKPKESDEFISMSCLILEKEYSPKLEQYEFSHAEFTFKFNIVKLSHAPCLFGLDEINIGDTISIGIYDYGKEINLCRASVYPTVLSLKPSNERKGLRTYSKEKQKNDTW